MAGCGRSLALVLAFAVVVLFCSNGVRSQDPPSPCEGSRLRSQECLQALKDLLQDADLYWFGSSYAARCPPNSSSGDRYCRNRLPQFTSIITRLRESDNDTSVDTFVQVLNVTFDVPSGSYQSCGQTYMEEAVSLTLDPLRRTPLSLWAADHVPEVTWEAAEAGKLYTLMVWDAGAAILHGLMYNINGSHLPREYVERAYNYRGPKNPSDRDQPYVFLLYEQTAPIEEAVVIGNLTSVLSAGGAFSPQRIVPYLPITGPVGVSILTVRTDPYSTQFMKRNRIVNNCPATLSPKFSALPLSYNVSKVSLVTSVDVMFTSPEDSASSCCLDVHYASNTRVPNPLGNGTISPVYTRFAPTVTLVHRNFDEYYFLRLKFTLLLLDVTDEISPTSATGASSRLPILHWHVTNIRQGDVTSGNTGLAYKAPMPLTGEGMGLGKDDRFMLFLLLRQAATVGPQVLPPGCDDRGNPLRCRFNLTTFITDHQMTIEGASWFLSSPDAYSRSEVIRQGLQVKARACAGVSQYQDPCLVCSASRAARLGAAGPETGALAVILLLVSVLGQLAAGHLFLPR